MSRERAAVRAYRALLRLLYPRPVRERDGEEIVATFAEAWSHATGVPHRIRFLVSSFGRLPVVALAEWRDHLSAVRRAASGSPRGEAVVDSIRRTFRAGLRALGRAPGFAWSVALLLGLGIGAFTTMLTIVDHVFLRPLPYPAAERLVRVNGSQSHPAVRDLRSILSVEAWTAASVDDAHLTGEGDPARIGQARVTDGFFAFFGARPSIGRLFGAEDFAMAGVVVLSYGAWERLWGRSADVVGRSITIDGEPALVAGVLSDDFAPPEALLDGAVVDVWRPVDPSHPDIEDRASRSLVVAGRLAPGATLGDARTEASELAERRARDFPDVYVRPDGSIVELPVVSLLEATVGGARERFKLLVAAVTLLLLVACVNVAHLFMARGLARSREMAVRRALGAATPALAGQLLVESLLTAAAGGIIGIFVAALGVRAFLAIDPEAVPRASAVTVDPRVLATGTVLCILTAVVFGLLPSLRTLASDPGDALRSDGRGTTGSRNARWLRECLVMMEVALSLMLVFCAGLLTRGFLRLGDEPLGFRTADVWTIRVGLAGGEDAGGWNERMERMADALRREPGVRSVTYGLSVPLEHVGGTCCWSRPIIAAGAEGGLDATIHPFAGGYADVFEPLVLAGRHWREDEATSSPPPALLNERMARALFGSVDGALGREIAIGAAGHVVVGVSAEDRHYGLYREHGRALYLPMESVPFVPDRLTLAVRMRDFADDVPRRLREAVWSVEPELPLPLVRSMSDWARSATARTRFDWWLFTAFGAAALLLAAAGLCGTLLYTVGLDRRELGIRLALGAGRRSVEARVLGRGLRTTAAGLAAGAVGAVAAGRLLESRLSGVEAGDPATLGAALAVLLSTAAAASWLPARRAGATDPLETLRRE